MSLKEENIVAGQNQQQTEDSNKPGGSRLDDGAGLEEKDLEKNFLFGKADTANPTEGKGTGGQNFGKENLTPAGNDKNNPTQMAGHTNAYFNRTEPSEEHPEDSNFTAKGQDATPDYSKAQGTSDLKNSEPKPEEPKRGNGENDCPNEQEPYSEGTADNDGGDQPNIPGPNELPDQQKVGEDNEKEDK